MKAPQDFVRIIDRRRYDVATATLIAADDYWDGHNFERHGRNTFLYRTPKGNYFYVCLSQWQGEQDTLTPITLDDAIDLYERTLSEHAVTYVEAFPGVSVVEA